MVSAKSGSVITRKPPATCSMRNERPERSYSALSEAPAEATCSHAACTAAGLEGLPEGLWPGSGSCPSSSASRMSLRAAASRSGGRGRSVLSRIASTLPQSAGSAGAAAAAETSRGSMTASVFTGQR